MGATKELHGVMVALVTPFTEDQKAISKEQLKALVDRCIDAGIHGLVPGGTTGEFTALTLEERKQSLELVIEYAAGRVPVVAGAGGTSTREILDLAEHARDAGASALMIVPPFYDPVNYEQLVELLSEVHQVSGLDIVYYNIPSASGLALSPKQIADMSKIGVIYLKDTSGNAPALTELLFGLHDQIIAFNGWDTLTFYGLAAGAKGTVWGASNIIPELSVQLWEAVAIDNDLKKGRELWSKIFPICKFLEEHNYPSAVKTGLDLLGHSAGAPRKPFKLLTGEPRKELATLLQDAGLKVVA